MRRPDRIRCEFPLIDPTHQSMKFQTEDLGRKNRDFTLTSHGRLTWHDYVNDIRPQAPRDFDLELDTNFLMYAEPESGGERLYYRVFLDEGQVTWIRPCNRLGQMGAARLRPIRRGASGR
jgi:hypothetical protein